LHLLGLSTNACIFVGMRLASSPHSHYSEK
jgi:hypothetical protein